MDFDLQSIWTATGMAAAAVIVGYLFGFAQSAVPAISSSATLRNYALMIFSAVLVLLAGLTSGKTLDDPDAVTNIFGGVIVFIGIYNAAKNAHGAGEATAVKTANGSEIGGGPSDPGLVGG